MVVQRGIPFGSRLELVKEVENDLRKRQTVPDFHSIRRQIIQALLNTTTLLTQLKDGADVLGRTENGGVNDGFTHLSDPPASRVLRRVCHGDSRSVFHEDVVNH